MNEAKTFNPEAAILGIEPRHHAAYLIVRCAACRAVYAALLPTVAGLPVGACACTACGHDWAVRPAEIAAALDRHWPEEPVETVADRADRARGLARTWSATPEAREALTYEGVALAELLEDGSYPYFMWALHRERGDA
ncbi:MAG: hypothetical protein R2834_14660 [Rhodothermales bacterium]